MSTPLLVRIAPLALALGFVACRPAGQPEAGAPAGTPGPATTPEAPPADATTRANFRCGDLLLSATFDNAAGTVLLDMDTRRLTLPQAVSASGARYADDAGNEFWNKGDDAMFTLDGTPQPDCTVTDEVSPWQQARERGVVFKGLGTEPGWSVEVGAGDSPQLRAELDYGERTVLVPRATGISSTPGFGGETADGTDVVLRIRDGDCSDGMSDRTYPAAIELQVGDAGYQGCGAWLDGR